MVDTESSIYFYAGLQLISIISLLKIGFERIQSKDNILILRVAGGKVVKILGNEIKFEKK